MNAIGYSFLVFYGLWCFGQCYQQVRPRFLSEKNYSLDGPECETQDDCRDLVAGSECLDARCRCPPPQVVSQDGTKCLKIAGEYGSPCEEDVQCSERLSSGGVCEKNVCRCKEGYHYLRGTCWKSRRLGQRCLKNEACFSSHDYRGQECLDKVCVCRSGYYDRFNSSCRKIRSPGESCNVDTDCRGDSTCEKMKCTGGKTLTLTPAAPQANLTQYPVPESESPCPKGRFLLNGTCVLELGMDCRNDSECSHISRALCRDNICSCEPMLDVSNESRRKCLPVAWGKTVDVSKSSCRENPQCSVFGENSYCNGRKCACRPGTYWDVQNGFCRLIKQLGETCVSDKDCYTDQTHAECLNTTNVCTCQEGYYERNSTCMQEAREVGAYCETTEDCLFDNSACNETNNTCECRQNHYVEKGGCVPGVGSDCDVQDDCSHLRNAKCFEGVCACENGHVKDDNGTLCLPVTKYGEPCQETFQCRVTTGPLSVCRNGTCTCRPTAHHYKEQCHRTRSIGQTCEKQQECFLANDTESTICLNGYCACHYDYVPDGVGRCAKTNSGSALLQSLLLDVVCIAAFLMHWQRR